MHDLGKAALAATVLAVGIVVAAVLLSRLFVRVRHEQAITVKGYAEEDVISDMGRFDTTITARGASLEKAYARLQEEHQAVVAYLRRQGFGDAEIFVGEVGAQKLFRRDSQGRETHDIEGYDLRQSVSVRSSAVYAVRQSAVGVTELLQQGIDIQVRRAEFYVTNLTEVKLRLLANATANGYKRAVTLATGSTGRVGALVGAEQGVFQVTERFSTDTSDYGEYDTSTIDKTAKAVVTLRYQVDRER